MNTWNRAFCLLALWILANQYPEQVLAQSTAPWVGMSYASNPCKGGAQGFGPFDYLNRAAFTEELFLVESAHFTVEVEQLLGGTSGALVADLDYTLRAWPNHHRALNAMIRYQSRLDSAALRALGRRGIPAAECYLQRALSFSPKDDMVYMLSGLQAHRLGMREQAFAAYERSVQLAPGNIQAKYNFALLLLEMGERARAVALASEVYAAGFPLQGLKKKLDDGSLH